MAEIYGRDIPWPLRALGCWAIQGRSARCRWGELSFSPGLGVVYRHKRYLNIQTPLGEVYINLPGRSDDSDFDGPRYGFRWSWRPGDLARDIFLNWGTRSKILNLPWAWQHVRHDVFDRAGNRQPWKSPWGGLSKSGEAASPPEDDGRYSETHPYTYVLRSGEVQNRTATIYGEEMEWRWRWFTWLPWPRMVRRTIDIRFDDEVGERTGSWKGGTVGCGWEWRKGETMLDALRRMERNRKFT